MSEPVESVEIDWRGRRNRIEYQWVGLPEREAPRLVFLHEGLGSVSMWRDFPDQLCSVLGYRGLVYSRPGYGASTPRAPAESWAPDFMHRQAEEVLPALLDQLEVSQGTEPPWLFGHSDGASIALIHAAKFPAAVSGLVLLAPHILVEAVSLAAIEQARQAYVESDLRQRLGRYHRDPDSAFYGWNDAWLDPAFRHWSIEAELDSIRCPILAVQGVDDEYGTLEQVDGIARRAPQTEVLVLEDCRHSPHRDQPQQLIEGCRNFMRRNAARRGQSIPARDSG